MCENDPCLYTRNIGVKMTLFYTPVIDLDIHRIYDPDIPPKYV